MKKLAVLLSLLAVLALIVATGNYKINAYRDVVPAVADGSGPAPPTGPVPPLFLADGSGPAPPTGPVPPLFLADGSGPAPPTGPVPPLFLADGSGPAPPTGPVPPLSRISLLA